MSDRSTAWAVLAAAYVIIFWGVPMLNTSAMEFRRRWLGNVTLAHVYGLVVVLALSVACGTVWAISVLLG